MTRKISPWIAHRRDGKTFVVLGGREYPVDTGKPPVFLFPAYLASRLPDTWIAAQQNATFSDRHPLVNWMAEFEKFLADYALQGVVSEYPGGLNATIKSLLILAYDMYSLDGNNKLQEALIGRLMDQSSFQSARYELGVAATMMRAGFEIEFENESDSSKKHPEFVAKDLASGTQIAVEAKSIHRSGVLGSTMGKPPPTSANASAHKIAAQIGGQVERALPKANGLPLYVFVELNLAPEIAEGLAPLIVDELESILPQIDTGCDANGKFVGRAMNLLTASNWAVHLGEAKHKGGETLNIFTSPRLADCRYPLDSVYADRVKIALTHYGTVADL